MTGKPLRDTIGEAKLSRIDSDLHRLRRHPNDGPMLSRFAYDHSNTLVVDSNGKTDLLISNDVPLASDIARLLQHVSPAMMAELVRGYRLARACGVLGDGKINPEVAKWFSSLNSGFSPGERVRNGYEQSKLIADELARENRKPGGIPFVDGETL